MLHAVFASGAATRRPSRSPICLSIDARFIRNLSSSRTLGAQKALFDSFNSSLQKTADTTWTLTKYWRLFRSGLESPIQTIAGALDSAMAPAQTAADMARTRARAQASANDRQAQLLSRDVTDRVTSFLPEVGSKAALENSAAFFRDIEKNTAAMSRMGVSVEDFYKAQEQASNKLAAYRMGAASRSICRGKTAAAAPISKS